MDEVAAAFVNQDFAYLLDTNIFIFLISCFLTVYLCDKAECIVMSTDNPLHHHKECYSCCSVFCFGHITKSKKNVLALTCMVDYYDNLLCNKCTGSEEEMSGHVGSYCFACDKNMCNQCFFEDAFLCYQVCGIMLCRKKSCLCQWDCDTCEFPYCLDCFKGHAARICDSCDAPLSVKTLSMCLTSVLSVDTDLWSMMTPLARKELWQICLRRTKKILRHV
jgi:hypothetical protein